MVKRWLTPQNDRPGSHLGIFLKIQMHMVKRWLTPQNDKPGSSLRIFLKIQHVYGQKMIDPLVWQTRISPGRFFKPGSPGIFLNKCTWSKDDWPPQNDRPGSHLELFLKIQHVYGQRMIDPASMTNQDLTRNFF